MSGRISFSFYVLFLLAVAIYTFKRPAYNWDMMAYMAIVASADNPRHDEVHATVYRTIAQELPPENYKLLTDGGNATRVRAANDPEFFRRYIPFYLIKPLYISLAYIFHKAGASLVQATILPGSLGYFLMGLLLLAWIRRYVTTWVAFAISMLLMISAPVIGQATLSSPDGISAFLLLSASFALLEKKNKWIGFFLLLLAVAARIDNIIFSVVVLGLVALSPQSSIHISKKQYLGMLCGMGLLYVAINLLPYAYGWTLFSMFKYYSASVPIAGGGGSFSLKQYLALRYSAVMTAAKIYHPFIYLLTVALLFIDVRQPFRWKRLSFDQQMSIVLPLIVIVRLMLYPDMGDRYYVAYYLVLVVLLVKKISGLILRREKILPSTV